MIFPSSFNPCVLYCNEKGNKGVQNILYSKHTQDTLFIELNLEKKVYEFDGSIFLCDYIDAVDGGFPFLCIYDVQIYCGISSSALYEERLVIIQNVVKNCFVINSEFRITSPIFFKNEEIRYVFDSIIPNFYGKTFGVQFTDDLVIISCNKSPLDYRNQEFIVRKTKYTEIYELYNIKFLSFYSVHFT